MNGIVGIIQAKFAIEFDIVNKQNCLFASILCGADLLFKQFEHKLWFTLEMDHCGNRDAAGANPYVPETLADRLKNDTAHSTNSTTNKGSDHQSPHHNTRNNNKSNTSTNKSQKEKPKQHISKVSECRGYSVWPVWDETICVAVLSECSNKSLWLKLYDDDIFLGQLYLDASEIDVDNVIRWYELDPGFER